MDIHKIINYRSWIITSLLLAMWSKKEIEDYKKAYLFDVKHLVEVAKIGLSYNNFTNGKSSYYRTAMFNDFELNKRKKLGVNYKGEQIGFGKNVIIK